ncbi:MAG: trans-aconitate 2-methyltransferase [Myxococcota bacterium]
MAKDDLYRDPSLYDLEYAHQVDDAAYYARMAAECGGAVLELGCGNGRVTLPIARTGTRVHGIDLAQSMLDDLEQKLSLEPKSVQQHVTWAQGDFCHFQVEDRYPLVMLPFNALHHCESHHDVLSMLACARAALTPGGRFAFDCYLPDPTLYARDPDARHDERDFIDPRTGQALRSWESGSYDAMTQVHTVRYIYRDQAGEEFTIELFLRMFYPQELRALIDWAGFRVVHEASGYSGKPLQSTSLKLVMVLEPK